jgi:hypothetical protein
MHMKYDGTCNEHEEGVKTPSCEVFAVLTLLMIK